MKYHCGFLTGTCVVPRYPAKIPASMYPELGVVLATPGFEAEHWAAAFRWWWPQSSSFCDYVVQGVDQDVARDNAASVTLDDGLMWLHRLLAVRPRYSGGLPLLVSMSLREVEARPADYGVSSSRMSTWKAAVGDPLFFK